jgi:hypothetical protein
MKIIGFSQLRNELEKGNLENWFKCMSICDYIYVYDQNSTDGSLDYYKKIDNLTVIESNDNKFYEEITCKSELLQKILTDHPDTDWIFWMDGDTILDNRLLENNGEELRNLCENGSVNKVDAFLFGHYNLWRSDVHYRIDDGYHWLHGKVVSLWRNNGNIYFPISSGLHQQQYPNGLYNLSPCDYSLIHRGFATDYQIMTKYDVYKSRGQNGWDLERLLSEQTLQVEKINYDLLPKWFKITDEVHPSQKEKIRDIYNNNK